MRVQIPGKVTQVGDNLFEVSVPMVQGCLTSKLFNDELHKLTPLQADELSDRVHRFMNTELFKAQITVA